jgi:hypothetical protein
MDQGAPVHAIAALPPPTAFDHGSMEHLHCFGTPLSVQTNASHHSLAERAQANQRPTLARQVLIADNANSTSQLESLLVPEIAIDNPVELCAQRLAVKAANAGCMRETHDCCCGASWVCEDVTSDARRGGNKQKSTSKAQERQSSSMSTPRRRCAVRRCGAMEAR